VKGATSPAFCVLNAVPCPARDGRWDAPCNCAHARSPRVLQPACFTSSLLNRAMGHILWVHVGAGGASAL